MSQVLPFSWSGIQAVAPAAAEPEKIDQLSNVDLVVRCQSQTRPDRVAFSELMRRYQAHVDKLLYHLAPDWSDRADLAQEVWIRVYRNLRRLNEPAKFKGWLGRIATNLFYDELRKRKRFESTISLDSPRNLDDGQVDWEIPCDGPSPVDNMMTQEFYECLKNAISELPDVFRRTIVLREIQGLPYEEIAELTGVSLGTVKSRIARARHRLQLELQTYLDGQQKPQP
jgi:RNA polymerase sigma-70 factor, ECF subfamily